MKITHLETKSLDIPFRVAFKHASAERTVTEALITIVKTDSGHIGYGEGCPRHYVTDETIASAISFFNSIKSEVAKISDISSLKDFVTSHHLDINNNPAAWCSIETALLDALGKECGQSLERLLGLPELQGSFKYSAVLGVTSFRAFQLQLGQYAKLEMNDFKVKLSGDLAADKMNLDALFKLPNIRVRIDANNHWRTPTDAIIYLQSLHYPFWAIEEPLQAGDYAGLATMASGLPSQIILDESFLRIEQFESLQASGIPWMLNIRLSKMGGILRSLKIIETATKNGFGFIIGAQVGETSILTRLALSLANAYRKNLLAQEGAFGTYLLEYDVAENPIMFKKNGLVFSESITGNGLGIDINERHF